jgi:Arc/MetJ-type ribon-helix-helix transcriptional regulator
MPNPITRIRLPEDLRIVVADDAKDRATSVSEVIKAAVVKDQKERGNWPPKRERK